MKYKSIIFDSELKFREYLIQNFEQIYKLFVFEDSLDNVIYFYCFFNNYVMIAAKEKVKSNFCYYAKLYKELAKMYELEDITKSGTDKVLKLKK